MPKIQVNTAHSGNRFHTATKGLFSVSLVIFFTPILILPFFNHAFTDDYFCGYYLNVKGFSGYQSFVYNECGGRFAATFTGSLFACNHFLYEHYYLHSILFLLLNSIASYTLLKVISRYIMQESFNGTQLLLYSLLMVSLPICCFPQPSTFIYWFSSSVTYFLPLILFQFQVALCIMLFNTAEQRTKNLCYMLIPVLLVLTNGFNELFIAANGFLFIPLVYFNRERKAPIAFLIFLAVVFIATAAIVVFAPGNSVRAGRIVPKGIAVGSAATAYQSIQTLWNIFKTPLFWFIAFAAFIAGNTLRKQVSSISAFEQLFQKKWVMPLIILLFIVSSVSLAVTGLKGGIIPDRYVNGVTYFTILLLLVYAFGAGTSMQPFTGGLQINPVVAKGCMYILFTLGLLCNNNFADACKSLISAPLYSSILKEREDALKAAGLNNASAVIKGYNTSLQEHLQKDYSQRTKTQYEMVQQKPPMLFFEDDLASEYGVELLKKFYRADSIVIQK